MSNRKPYPSDVPDQEWAFVAPYLALIREDAPQRTHDLKEVFSGLRWVVRTGSPWRYMPHDFPPWEAVYQQTRRWLGAGVFEAMVHDLRALLRTARGRERQPTVAFFDSRTLRSTPESGHKAGYDGAKRGSVLLPHRWMVERHFVWAWRFRRLGRGYERLPQTGAGLHFVAFACLFLHRAICAIGRGP